VSRARTCLTSGHSEIDPKTIGFSQLGQPRERVQLLLKDKGDTYFRLYMFLDGGGLRNVAPEPGE